MMMGKNYKDSMGTPLGKCCSLVAVGQGEDISEMCTVESTCGWAVEGSLLLQV